MSNEQAGLRRIQVLCQLVQDGIRLRKNKADLISREEQGCLDRNLWPEERLDRKRVKAPLQLAALVEHRLRLEWLAGFVVSDPSDRAVPGKIKPVNNARHLD